MPLKWAPGVCFLGYPMQILMLRYSLNKFTTKREIRYDWRNDLPYSTSPAGINAKTWLHGFRGGTPRHLAVAWKDLFTELTGSFSAQQSVAIF